MRAILRRELEGNEGDTSRCLLMREGDLVILYKGHTEADYVFLAPGGVVDNKFGRFEHNDFIGQPFGSRINSRGDKGWVLALESTTDLWAAANKTRTQIVDSVDSSIITTQLDLFPGCAVVESGTGSGNMTLAMAKCVAPTGHIHTYEYNGSRAEAARDDFAKLGLAGMITVHHGDVCGKYHGSTGGFEGVVQHSVDAVFLDLPEPWLALDHAKYVLKPGRNICTYSPCMEQVMRTCEALREAGFFSVRMVEVRQRPFDAKYVQFEQPDTGRNSDNMFEIPNTVDSTEGEKANSSQHSKKRKLVKLPEPPRSILCARPENSMKGHTAFLTFAYSPPPQLGEGTRGKDLGGDVVEI